MANFVIKKDGTKVPFDEERIRSAVVAAATQSGQTEDAAEDIAGKVVEEVSTSLSGQEEVQSSEIKEKVLFELDTMAPDVSASWKKYDESMGK